MTIEKTTGRVLDTLLSGDHSFLEVVDPLNFVAHFLPGSELPQLEALVSWLEEEVPGYVPSTRKALISTLLTEKIGDDWNLYMSSDQPARFIYRQNAPLE